MMLSRRDLLAAAGAMPLLAARPLRAVASDAPILHARPGSAALGPAGTAETAIWGYGGGTPGPVLRVRQGARVAQRLVNALPQSTTVHWHGIRIDNAMDGVPDLTQETVSPDGAFLYDFVAPDAGTYWYHPHDRTWEQMARGLYGALIVEEPAPPEVDRDEVLLIDDWRLTAEAGIDESFGAMMDWSHAGRFGNWVTVNGDGAFKTTVRRHERLRLRLVNTANARIFPLELPGFEGWIVALDGQPLAAPTPLGRLVLAPAQRADLIVDVTAPPDGEAFLAFHDRDARYELATFRVEAERRPERLPAPPALAPNPLPAPGDLGKAQRATLRMEGGAMGGLRGAMLAGRMTGIRDLVDAGKVWAFNGMAEMPEQPLVSASRGETVRITMINDTSWPHAMHLHGHHVRQVMDGERLGPLRDTLLVDRDETVEIVFVADNPGRWLLHCHMLEHAVAGMMTWLEVA